MEAVEVGGLGMTGEWLMVTRAHIFSFHSRIPNIWPSSKGLRCICYYSHYIADEKKGK